MATALLRATVLSNPFIPHTPTAKQAVFLTIPVDEALYGGAAGGGKSDALLMGALQYADVPGYRALLLRRTYADLALPGALMDRAAEWLRPSGAIWADREHTWHFPSGASLTFGYLDNDADMYRYQGAEFQLCGFDEKTQFTERQYLYLFSRLRRLATSSVPLRMRGATNPGGIGHDWVNARFNCDGRGRTEPGRMFIPALLDDNPYLDREAYEDALGKLDPVTRAQLRRGDWTVRLAGGMFRREWFPIVDAAPAGCRWVRRWDMAGTVPDKRGSDPDWTVGALVGLCDGVWYVSDVHRVRASAKSVNDLVMQTAMLDGQEVMIREEQEPGSAGKAVCEARARMLAGYNYRGIPATGAKTDRAAPVSAAAEAGNVRLVNGAWVSAFLSEYEAFPNGSHDDQVDPVSGAFTDLARRRGPLV